MKLAMESHMVLFLYLTATLFLSGATVSADTTVLTEVSADLTIRGPAQHSRTGYAITAGDFNGDGNVDLAVSSEEWDQPDGSRNGEVEIIWGDQLRAGGVVELRTDPDVARIIGRIEHFPLFITLAAGDTDGDGIDDLIIGQPMSPPPGGSRFDGLVYVVYGSTAFPDTVDLADVVPNAFTLVSGPSRGWFGATVAACDMDNDGYCDMVISAPALEFGQLFVVRGSPDRPKLLDLEYDLSSTMVLTDVHPGQFFGRKLACGDVDLDGYPDILVGAPGNYPDTWGGLAALIYGREDIGGSYSLDDAELQVVYITSEFSDTGLGTSVALSDLNDDGYPELLIGAAGAEPDSCRDCGTIYVVSDPMSLMDPFQITDEDPRVSHIIGSADRRWLGKYMSATRPDGDSPALTAATMALDLQTSTRDTVYICPGTALLCDTLRLESSSACARLVSEYHQEELGRIVEISDFNGDGVNDYALGAFGYDSNRGRVFVVFGTEEPVGPTPAPALRISVGRPNPFTTATVISYELRYPGRARIDVFSVRGEHVRTIVDRLHESGPHQYNWNGRDTEGTLLPSGVYFVRVNALNETATAKAVIIR